jgi:predicted membrane channel-forming protein YqfA (hemolysin III family)
VRQGQDNDEGNRLDRELIELLNELRVVLPGVQVLFAFLLTVPFTNRFSSITNTQRQVFFATFLLTTAATALLIAPSAYHRLRWRQHDKEQMLRTANRLSIGGMVFLTLALVCATFLVADLILHVTGAAIVTAVVAGFFAWFWWGLPLWRRLEDSRSSSRASN